MKAFKTVTLEYHYKGPYEWCDTYGLPTKLPDIHATCLPVDLVIKHLGGCCPNKIKLEFLEGKPGKSSCFMFKIQRVKADPHIACFNLLDLDENSLLDGLDLEGISLDYWPPEDKEYEVERVVFTDMWRQTAVFFDIILDRQSAICKVSTT